MNFDWLNLEMAEVSDWHLCRGERLRVRCRGELKALEHVVSAEDLAELAAAAPRTDSQVQIARGGAQAMFRVHRFTAAGRDCASLRHIPATPPKLGEIAGLPEGFRQLLRRPEGLVLVGGATGAGKSTTIAAALDALNEAGGHCILTLEDPIEFRHAPARDTIIYQTAWGLDFTDWAQALKDALRKDPDVILVGEMRDLATMHAAIHAAHTGHLVFATVHGGDVPSVIDRIVSVFAAADREKLCALLANALIGVLAQKLVPTIDGRLTPVFEFLGDSLAARTTIRENRLHQLAAIVAGQGNSFDTHLERLLAHRRITPDTASRHHSQPERSR